MTPGGRAAARGGRFWWARAPLLIVLLAALLRVWMPGPPIMTTDELTWLTRSHRFEVALEHGDFASANIGAANEVGTRPGVTTMWIGAVAEKVAEHDPLDLDEGTLRYAHILMGLFCALLLWPFILLSARLVGRRAALVAGGLIAVEPLMVGHSAILHTDALVAMTTGTAVVAIVAAFEALRSERAQVDRPAWWKRRSVQLGAAAGGFAALGWLTKLNAVIVLGVVVLAVIGVHVAQVFRRGRSSDRESLSWGAVVRQSSGAAIVLAVAAAAFLVVAIGLWPAMWVDPISNIRATISVSDLASTPSRHLFLGTVESGGDWRLYPVELWFRTSPWLLLGGVFAVGWKIWSLVRHRARVVPRRIALPLVAPALVYLIAITVSEKQYTRYLLPLLPLAAIGIGVVAAEIVRSLGAGRGVRAVGWAGFAAAALVTASLAPYAISFVDPLVGGQRVAERNIQLGWGEGKERITEEFGNRTVPGTCPTWSSAGGWLNLCPRLDFTWLNGTGPPPEYVFRDVFSRQLGDEPKGLDAYLSEHGRLVKAVTIDGVRYAELWELTRS